eukprot:m.26106 g.26106  ORF g.26106 m.26106 type:complete len:263 (-) comp11650_c0_seq2:189-977(-)
MDEYDMQDLYSWIDELPLSRPKRHIARDFSDGVLAAEIVNQFKPRLVDLHNYQPANSVAQKITNWTTLNNKVFKKIGLTVPPNVINGVASQKPGVIEVVLNNMRLKLQQAAAPPRTASEVPVHYDDQYDGHEAEMYDMPTPPHRAERGGRKKKGPTFPPLGNRTATLPPQQRRAAAPRPPPQLHSNGPPRGGGPRRNYEPTPPPPPPRGSARGDYGDYDDMAAELEACQETMDIMQIKIEKLTRLVHLKEKRIEDLKRSIPV